MGTQTPQASGLFGRELLLRIASALVMGVVALGFLWWGGIAFAVLAAAMSVLILHEWVGITGPFRLRLAVRVAYAFVAFSVIIATDQPVQATLFTWVVAGGILLAASADRHLVWLAGGLLYATLPGIACVMLRDSSAAGSLDSIAVIFVFLVVWATDTAAYFSGRLIGGPKLAPRFSPKKTWSGAIGGASAAVVVGLVVALVAGIEGKLWAAAIAFALSVVSQFGDLGESALKRRFDVKDSGALIPGHGGIMDRVDGLVASMVVAVIIGLLRGGDDIAAGLLVW